MGEDGQGIDKIEAPVRIGQGRTQVVHFEAAKAQVPLAPFHEAAVVVAAVDFPASSAKRRDLERLAHSPRRPQQPESIETFLQQSPHGRA